MKLHSQHAIDRTEGQKSNRKKLNWNFHILSDFLSSIIFSILEFHYIKLFTHILMHWQYRRPDFTLWPKTSSRLYKNRREFQRFPPVCFSLNYVDIRPQRQYRRFTSVPVIFLANAEDFTWKRRVLWLRQCRKGAVKHLIGFSGSLRYSCNRHSDPQHGDILLHVERHSNHYLMCRVSRRCQKKILPNKVSCSSEVITCKIQ